jgi:hypothetical protein
MFRFYTCAQQKIAQISDQISVTYATLVRVMQETINSIQANVKACAMCRRNRSTHMMQQGFNFSPVYITADGIMKNGTQLIFVFMTHLGSPCQNGLL